MLSPFEKHARPNRWFAILRQDVSDNIAARGQLPDLTEDQVLSWAEAHLGRTGKWPTCHSGPIPEAAGETWLTVEAALYLGRRGFPGGSTVARFLNEKRGVPIHGQVPDLTEKQILHWADQHHRSKQAWPHADSGPVVDARGENWNNIDAALRNGSRGLATGSSLARLLAEHRGVPNRRDLAPFKVGEILRWAESHRKCQGSWPTKASGPIPESDGDTWLRVDAALRMGIRGLPGGSSLAQLLAKRRGRRNIQRLPALSHQEILVWCDAHFQAHGQWPTQKSGKIGRTGETWASINQALLKGSRGLPAGSSLARLLAQHRGVRNRKGLPKLNESMILVWARAHHVREGTWPKPHSGPIREAPGETWTAVDMALRKGLRGLPGGSSLPRLLAMWLAKERNGPTQHA